MAERAWVTVVSGPPCSGKSTFVDEHREPGDVVVDLDRIAHALGYPAEHVDWSEVEHHPARVAAMIARASVLKAVRSRRVSGHVWVIHSTGIVDLGGAAFASSQLDPGRDVCVERARAAGRPASTLEQIDRWYGVADAVDGSTSQDW